jgi:tetratricopeptide (TPR) repeat protein
MPRGKIEEAIKNINSFKDLCDYVISLDEQEPATPDPLGIGKKIDEILEIAERLEIKEELKQKDFFDLGFQATENKNYKEAIKYYSKVIEDENELKSDAHYNLAICFLSQKDYGLAAEHYTVFCTREPQEATSDLLEHIEILRSASMLSPEEGYKLVKEYNKKTSDQLSALDLKDSKITINDFLNKLNILLQMEIINAKEPFDKIIKNESAKIPLKVYNVPALKDLDPKDVLDFCDALIRYGVAVSIILFDVLEKRRITIKDPPYEKSYSKSEVSKRCPGNWLFIKTILDIVVETQAQNFLAKKPWVRDCMDSIKEPIIREFVYEGFSIGLESGGY